MQATTFNRYSTKVLLTSIARKNTKVLKYMYYLIILGPKSSLNFINIPISNTIRNNFHNPNSHTINYTPYYRVRTPPLPWIKSSSKRLQPNFWGIWHLKKFPLVLLLLSQTLFSSLFFSS